MGKIFFSKPMGSRVEDVKASGQTLWWFNTIPKQILGIQIQRDNGQDQIVRSGNYCCSSIGVSSVDKNKNTAIERLPWFTLKPLVKTTLLFEWVKKGRVLMRLEPWSQCSKISYRAQTKTKITKMQTHSTNSDIQH